MLVTAPAPVWRRLLAAIYDGLLLLGLWLGTLIAKVIVYDQLLGLPDHRSGVQLLLFGVGLFFFGWFWTHGGQTLGMRSWRLQVRRLDGQALRWPVASLRFTVMLASWGVVLAAPAFRLPRLAAHPQALEFSVAALLLTAGGFLLMRLDARRRAPCDFLSGTEVVVLATVRRHTA